MIRFNDSEFVTVTTWQRNNYGSGQSHDSHDYVQFLLFSLTDGTNNLFYFQFFPPSSTRIQTLAKGLSPAVFRVGGKSSDQAVFLPKYSGNLSHHERFHGMAPGPVLDTIVSGKVTWADPGFFVVVGGGRARNILCAHAHYEREARSPFRPGPRARLRALWKLSGFLCSLVLSEHYFKALW